MARRERGSGSLNISLEAADRVPHVLDKPMQAESLYRKAQNLNALAKS